MDPLSAAHAVRKAVADGADVGDLARFMRALGLRWENLERHSRFSLSFSLLGGAMSRIL